MDSVVPRPGAGALAVAPTARTVIALSGGAILLGVLLVALAFSAGEVEQPALSAVLACWVTLPYLFAGIVAWQRRPDSSLGILMIAAGLVTFVNFLIWAHDDLIHTVGLATQVLPPILFLHVFLAFPGGRLESRLDRFVVAAAYVAAALTIPALLVGLGTPRNVIALADAPAAAELIQAVQLLLVSVLALAGIAVLVRRRRRRTARPVRPAIGWLVDSFALGLLMIAVLLLSGVFEWTAVQEPVRFATFAAIGAAPIVFLVGLLQARLGRAGVAELLVDLGVNPGPAELQTAVARALRDPSATLAYWLPEFGAYADVDGHHVDLEARAGQATTPILRDGNPVALLLHDPALDDEPTLLEAVAVAAGIAIQNAQLQVDLRAHLADVRASRARIVSAGDAARQRLERDLHDGAQQRLVALSLALRRARGRIDESADEGLADSLAAASQLAGDALSELRELARGIHPAVLTETGLVGALPALARGSPVPVTIEEVPPERLAPELEATAYFFVSEALANVAKHAPAASARVRLRRDGDTLAIEVADDGPGGAAPRVGSGLQGLDDRVAAVGGHLVLDSPIGGGTRLLASIPIDAHRT